MRPPCFVTRCATVCRASYPDAHTLRGMRDYLLIKTRATIVFGTIHTTNAWRWPASQCTCVMNGTMTGSTLVCMHSKTQDCSLPALSFDYTLLTYVSVTMLDNLAI